MGILSHSHDPSKRVESYSAPGYDSPQETSNVAVSLDPEMEGLTIYEKKCVVVCVVVTVRVVVVVVVVAIAAEYIGDPLWFCPYGGGGVAGRVELPSADLVDLDGEPL